MEDRQKVVSQILKELKEDYPDFNVETYRKDISDRLSREDEIEDLTEMEILLLDDSIEWEDEDE